MPQRSEPGQYRPPPHSGARPIRVPRPEQIRRPGYPPPEPDRSLNTEDRDGAENERWRTGRRPGEEPAAERPDRR